MNKRQLIEALEKYPDDAPVVVARDHHMIAGIECGIYEEDHRGAKIFALSDDPDVVRFEL